jgi:hypothetical protein
MTWRRNKSRTDSYRAQLDHATSEMAWPGDHPATDRLVDEGLANGSEENSLSVPVLLDRFGETRGVSDRSRARSRIACTGRPSANHPSGVEIYDVGSKPLNAA